MKRIALPAIVLAAVLCLHVSAPAQQTPPANPQPAKPLVLDAREVALWQHWLRADHKACYEAASAMLEDPACAGDQFRVALGLLTRSAIELGWHKAAAKLLGDVVKERTGPEADFARLELIEALKRAGDMGPIHGHTGALGVLTRWAVLGPFANDRGQGFEDVLEPETEFNLAAEYAGKDGQTVTWRELPARPLAGEVNLGAMLRPNTEAVAYLTTSIHVAEACEAVLLVASTGDIRVWHLGRVLEDADADSESPLGVPVLESHEERAFGFDQDQTALQLNAGWNTLIVKSGVAENDWRVRLRLSGPKFREAAADERAEIPAPEAFTVKAAKPPALPFESAAELARRVMLEMLYPRLDVNTAAPKRHMQDVLAAYDEHLQQVPEGGRAGHNAEGAALRYLAAWANRSTTSVAAGREENQRRELLQQSLSLDPQAARSALELSYYYTGTFANPRQADEYASLAIKLAPHWSEARVFASRVVQMKGLDMEAERELAAMLKQYPDDARVLRYSAYYAGQRGDYATSNKLFEQAIARDQSDRYSLERVVERAVQRGDLKLALEHARKLQALDPFDTWSHARIAEGHEHAGDYKAAADALGKALAIAPRDDALLEQLGRVYADWAYADPARAAELHELSLNALREALAANPKREDIERYMEFLDGAQPPFEAALQEGLPAMEARIKQAMATPPDPNEPYEVLYQDTITVINEDGTTSRYVQQAYRVCNDDGRRWLQNVPVPAWGGQQGRCVFARVWRAAGGHEEGRRSRYSAGFPPLQTGDVVHVRFRVTDRERSFFGDFFGTIEVLADYVPVRHARVCFVLAPGKEYHEYLTLDAPKRRESQVNGRRVWSYEKSDIPKLVNEPLAPPSEQRAFTIQLSTYGNWADFGRWYYNLIRKQMQPTPEMTRKVQQLTAGLGTEHDKARVLYEWVVTQVRYNADWHFGVHGYKPFSAGAVFARCIGDCKDKAILLCTMLEIAGIKAYPVIINLEEFRGREDITLPMPHHFNHAIACIEYADGRLQFVDGTATYSGFDELPSYDAGADVIVVKPDGGVRMLVPQLTPEQNQDIDTIEAECIGGGTLRVQVTRTAAGGACAGLRSGFLRPGDRKRQLELEYSRHFPGAKVIEVTASDLSDLRNPPEIRFTLELPNAYTEKDGVIELRQSLTPSRWGQTALASLATRKADLLLPPPHATKWSLTLKLPTGMKCPNPPASFSAESKYLKLSLAATAAADGKSITIRGEVAMQGGIVPVADYVDFRRALVDFDAAELRVLKLTR